MSFAQCWNLLINQNSNKQTLLTTYHLLDKNPFQYLLIFLLIYKTFLLKVVVANYVFFFSPMVPSVAEFMYLDKVKWLEMYGVDLHPVKVWCFFYNSRTVTEILYYPPPPPRGLFISDTFERGGGGLIEMGGLFNLAKRMVSFLPGTDPCSP